MTAQTGATDVRVEVSVEAPIEHAFKVFTTRCGSGVISNDVLS